MLQDTVLVVKAEHRYFLGITKEDAQAYFDEGSVNVRTEPVTETLGRVGLESRSVHQIVGKCFLSSC